MEDIVRIQALLSEIEKYDTPSVTNVVASYPLREEVCLGLYSPWTQRWSSNNDLKCHTPELGSKAGYAVTYVIGMQEPGFNRLSYRDLFDAIEKSPKPVIVCLQQDFPEEIKKKCGPTGGMICGALKRLGAVGLITDGPVRDLQEIKEMGNFQYMSNGLAPSHGVVSVRAVNAPVHICGMDIAPGEIIHTDVNGAVKFPADKLEAVVEKLRILSNYENKRAAMVREADNTAEAVKKAFFEPIDGIK
jgi:4-hydroxy-4-methyl-2-oxoglutarate aldolase